MEWVLEALAISFVAIAAVWFVVAQAYGILNGIAEAPSILAVNAKHPATETRRLFRLRGGNYAESDRGFDCAFRIHCNSRSADERLESTKRLSAAEERLEGLLSTAKEPVEQSEGLPIAEERVERFAAAS